MRNYAPLYLLVLTSGSQSHPYSEVSTIPRNMLEKQIPSPSPLPPGLDIQGLSQAVCVIPSLSVILTIKLENHSLGQWFLPQFSLPLMCHLINESSSGKTFKFNEIKWSTMRIFCRLLWVQSWSPSKPFLFWGQSDLLSC